MLLSKTIVSICVERFFKFTLDFIRSEIFTSCCFTIICVLQFTIFTFLQFTITIIGFKIKGYFIDVLNASKISIDANKFANYKRLLLLF